MTKLLSVKFSVGMQRRVGTKLTFHPGSFVLLAPSRCFLWVWKMNPHPHPKELNVLCRLTGSISKGTVCYPRSFWYLLLLPVIRSTAPSGEPVNAEAEEGASERE